jgi:trk system potassium uptake protein TrkA
MNVILVGGGRVGSYLASLLVAEKYHVKVIEKERGEIDRLQQDLPPDTVVLGDGTDPDLLKRNGITRSDVVVAVTGTDETNLVVTSLARFEFNVPRTIARVNDPKNAWLFTPKMGVDAALSQAELMAHLIQEEMSLGDMMTLLKLHKGQYSLVEEKVDYKAIAAGKAVHELDLPEECILVAIIREGQLIVPHGNTVLEPLDEVLALVHASQLQKLAGLLGPLPE